MILKDRVVNRFFPPQVALYLVKIACERPDAQGRTLSQWDSRELARQLVKSGVVASISIQTVQRILSGHHSSLGVIICGCRQKCHEMKRLLAVYRRFVLCILGS